MNTVQKIFLVVHVILLIYFGVFTVVDLLDSDKFNPFYEYAQIREIRLLLYFELALLVAYLLYCARIGKLIRLELLYNSRAERTASAVFVGVYMMLKVAEISIRSNHYYGEVKDKHGDWAAIFFLIFPIYQIVKGLMTEKSERRDRCG